MRILIVKTSSLGDVIHNLPLIGDIHRHFPEAVIDWCVEESFAALVRLHPGVNEVIPVALRRWKKRLLNLATWREMRRCQQQLASIPYDLVLDTQGLLKSALIASRAHGIKCGHAADSAREPLAARFYERVFSIPKQLHAVTRNRLLAAAALGYRSDDRLDFGIQSPAVAGEGLPPRPFVVLLTATSRDDKLWPEANWLALGRRLQANGFSLVLPGGSAPERQRAERLAAALPGALAAPPMTLDELAGLIGQASAVVGVDTGLTHLAVALQVPTIAIYTATDPGLTGVFGSGFFKNLGGKTQEPDPESVFAALWPALA
jgi:heptosyltransferase-1